ncbi:hypothetical protein J2T50_000425 [Streptococcus gallinaceus]|uniref:Uncharacterized protein n=1 Tax=Streptococcus gallinaceus TaxID=165758 RepID=A0ABV2JLM8_9STRE|nr:hypothetical protein [Streptococcus gallinaceus]MCP1769181.1 hypothetical protein [Streptococcus gallinaceus]
MKKNKTDTQPAIRCFHPKNSSITCSDLSLRPGTHSLRSRGDSLTYK